MFPEITQLRIHKSHEILAAASFFWKTYFRGLINNRVFRLEPHSVRSANFVLNVYQNLRLKFE